MEQRDSSNFLSYQRWIGLPELTRVRIAGLFNIPRSLDREVFDNRVIQDGYTVASLAAITTQGMQEILKSDSKDFYHLFDALVEFVNKPVETNVEPNVEVKETKIETTNVQQEKQTEIVAPAKKRPGRKPKIA